MSQAGEIDVVGAHPQIPTQFDANVGFAIPIGNVLEILGVGGVTTVASGNTVNIIAASGGFTWNVVTSVSPANPITLVPGNGYICKGASAVTFILPASAVIGDAYSIVGYGNLWTIQQNANQSITLGIKTTTVGAGGSLTATYVRDTAQILCVTTNLEFQLLNSTGNPAFI